MSKKKSVSDSLTKNIKKASKQLLKEVKPFKPAYYEMTVDNKITYHLNCINTLYRYDNIVGTSNGLDHAKHLVEIFNQLKKEDR